MGEPEVIRHVKAEFRVPGSGSSNWREYTIDVFSNGNITYHLGRQVQYTFDSFMGPEAIKKCRKPSMFGSLKKTFDRVNRYDFIKDGKVVLSMNFGYTGDPMEKHLKDFLSKYFTEVSACLSGGRKRKTRKRGGAGGIRFRRCKSYLDCDLMAGEVCEADNNNIKTCKIQSMGGSRHRKKTRKNKRRRKRGGVKESNAPDFHDTWSKDFPVQSQKDLQQQQLTHGTGNLIRSSLGLPLKKKKAAPVHPIGGRKRRKTLKKKKNRKSKKSKRSRKNKRSKKGRGWGRYGTQNRKPVNPTNPNYGDVYASDYGLPATPQNCNMCRQNGWPQGCPSKSKC